MVEAIGATIFVGLSVDYCSLVAKACIVPVILLISAILAPPCLLALGFSRSVATSLLAA